MVQETGYLQGSVGSGREPVFSMRYDRRLNALGEVTFLRRNHVKCDDKISPGDDWNRNGIFK